MHVAFHPHYMDSKTLLKCVIFTCCYLFPSEPSAFLLSYDIKKYICDFIFFKTIYTYIQLFQVVSNANLEIMDIVAHWRGSTHDSRIFNECRLKQRFEQSEFKGRLLGDSGYACTPYLFTPILNPTSQKEEMYNRAHIRTRNTVERCFGVWKQRFRCLLRGFTTKLEHTKLYIIALAILHNIAMKKQDLLDNVEENGDNDNIPVAQVGNNSLRGNSARGAFINENF